MSSTIVSGNTYQDVKSIAENMNIQIMSSRTFHQFAAKYVYPAVDKVYFDQMMEIREEIKAKQQQDKGAALNLAMDGWYSRPGYTATYGVVSVLDIDMGKILDGCVLKKNDAGITSSANMETVGIDVLLKSILRPLSNTVPDDDDQPSTSSAVPVDRRR